MSVIAAFRSPVPDVRRRSRTLRAALSLVVARLAASPLDSSVLGVIGVPRGPQRPAAPPARRHTVTGTGCARERTGRQALSDETQCSRRQTPAHTRS